jgi:hypothetical protein
MPAALASATCEGTNRDPDHGANRQTVIQITSQQVAPEATTVWVARWRATPEEGDRSAANRGDPEVPGPAQRAP